MMSTPDPTTQWTEAMQDLALLFIDLAKAPVNTNNPDNLRDHIEELYDDLGKLQIILADNSEDMTEDINLVLNLMGHRPLEPM